ncbi:hypothetical protein ACE1B6_18140 [Aerosakkonemataceae cyanobacterium BLCC-F154]|uniref:Uncharacterized protein n=1 Tax=Floridaenema fluviatile BLCC-F154 TaxID=3153640 RepID=A0ABV4YH38_9CYAN
MWQNISHRSLGEKTSPINNSPISEVAEKLTDLKVSRQNLTKLMNLEIWAIVTTTDDFFPGFWYRFMSNRQLALKKLVQREKDLPKK